MTAVATRRRSSALDALPAIGLDELVERSELQTRVDRKYVVDPATADELVALAPAGTRALDIDGERTFGYTSVYLDTPDLVGYLLAAHRRRRRFKVRSRCYDASGLAFLEVKTRDGARTVKTRLEGRHVRDDGLTDEGRAFVAATLEDAGIATDVVSELVPVLRTRYRRSTLHLADDASRVTVDRDLTWRDELERYRRARSPGSWSSRPSRPARRPRWTACSGRAASAPPGSASTPPGWRPSTPHSPTTAGRARCAATSDQENPMKLSRITAALSAAALAAVLAGCGTTGTTTGSGSTASGTTATSTATATAGASVTAVLADNQESHATADDLTYAEADVVDVTLSGSTATADGDGVEVDGATVTITAPGTYRLTGTLAGQVVVDTSAEGDVRVILDDATITSTTTSAIAVMAADEAVVILADGSTNALTDGSSYGDGEGEANAALYSAADLTIAGNGALTVTGNTNDGIGAQDGLVISSGTVTVTAVDDAIRGKDYVRVEGGTRHGDRHGRRRPEVRQRRGRRPRVRRGARRHGEGDGRRRRDLRGIRCRGRWRHADHRGPGRRHPR